MSSTYITRRNLIIGSSTATLSACIGTPNYTELDNKAITTRERLFANYAEARKAADNAAGYIVFPSIKKAGLIFGGSTGRGSLFHKRDVIGHYSVNAVSWGLQAGIQDFSMILFFMTEEAMAKFRSSHGVEFATDIEYALPDRGAVSIGASSATYRRPVYALIFNQTGIMVGASLRGAVYTAI